MKYVSFWWMFQPSSRGRMTLWPRLEIGNSSANPCSRPSRIAWKYEIGAARITTVCPLGQVDRAASSVEGAAASLRRLAAYVWFAR